MALETTTNRAEFAGNGATTAFSFPYYFLAEADLVVIIRNNTTGVETLKTLTTHYTVTGEGTEAGGTVTMLSAPASGETLIIYRDPEITQGTDFRENDSLPAEETEKAFDRAAMISQRLSERLDRAVRLSDGFSPDFDTTLPTDLDDAAGKIPLINEDSDGWADAADWPDIDGITESMQAAADAADASADAAAASASASATSAAASATSATNSATSATNSATSATASANSATAAAGSATAAAASATAAANTLASALWRGVLRKTSADSPYTVTSSDNGKLIVVDTTSGAVTINLPSIAGLTLPFTVGIQLDAGTNAITIARNGTDTIDGATSKSISVTGSGAQLLADTTPAPDEWEVIDFGAQAGNMTVDNFSGTGSQTAFTLSVDPGSENNINVFVDGVYQQKNTFSVSGTTLTFSSAPPAGTSNIEVMIGTTLSIGTPSDGTVSKAKLAAGAFSASVASKTASYSVLNTDDVVIGDATSGAITFTLPAAASNTNKLLHFKKKDSSANAVTIDGNASETIDGDLTFTLSKQYQALTIVSDGSNWHVVEFFAAGEVKTATSSTKTPAGTTHYHQLSNNSISLTPGRWRLWPTANFTNSGAPGYSAAGVGIAGGNGADSSTQPTTLGAVSNLTVLSVQKDDLTTYCSIPTGTGYLSGAPVDVKVAATLSLYVVTWSEQSTSANARVIAYLNAERIG